MEAALRGPQGKIALESAVLTIGSSPDNQLVVNDPKVSAYHAEIRQEGQGYTITDPGSTHGTYVNGQRLDWNTPHLLTPGSTVAVGDTTFTYEESDAALLATPLKEAGSVQDMPASSAAEKFSGFGAYSSTIPAESAAPGYQQFPPAGSTPPPNSNPGYASPQSYITQYPPPYMQQYPPPGYPGMYPGYAGPIPAAAIPARRSGRRWLWVLVAIVVVVAAVGAGAAIYFTRPTPEKTLDTYCNALRGQDYRGAYDQLSASLQSIETEAQFAGAQEAVGRVTTCTHDSPNVTGDEATSNLTLISSGQTYTGIISLIEANNSWKINVLLSSPQLTLTAFCNALRSGDFQTAYNQLSSDLRANHSEATFVQDFTGLGCTFGSIDASGSGGSAAIVFVDSTGKTTDDVAVLIQDPASNSDWKIDGIEAAS